MTTHEVTTVVCVRGHGVPHVGEVWLSDLRLTLHDDGRVTWTSCRLSRHEPAVTPGGDTDPSDDPDAEVTTGLVRPDVLTRTRSTP